MQGNSSSIVIGILAGAAAGLMAVAGFRAGFAGFLLVMGAPFAIYIAAMGWGTLAGLAAALAASACLFLFGGPASALIMAALLFLPAAWVGHLVNLGQPSPNGSGMMWYPLPLVLLRLMMALAGGFILAGFITGYTVDNVAPEFAALMRELAQANPELALPADDEIEARSRFYAGLIPLLVPSLWLLFHVLVGYTAAAITRRSGKLARQPEPPGQPFIMPPETLGFAAAGLVGSFFLDGVPAMVGMMLLGLAISGYAVAGLVDLHQRAAKWPSGGLVLFFTYGAIALFSLPLLIFTISGLVRSLSAKSNSGGPGAPGSPNE